MGTIKRTEAPGSAEDADCFSVYVRRVTPGWIHNKSTLGRPSLGRKIDGPRLGLHMKNKVVRQFGCEDQRCSVDRQHKRGLIQAENLSRFHRSQWRKRRRSNWWQSDHEHRFWIAERRRVIEPQIELILFRQH